MSLGLSGDGVISGFDAAASGFGGLVAVKHVLKTDTFSASVTARGNVAVTDLEITHALAAASNKLIISAYFGASGSDGEAGSRVGIAVHDGTNLLAIGQAAGNRTQVGAGGFSGGTGNEAMMVPNVMFVHEPGDTTSRTYTVRVINIQSTTNNVYVNRTGGDVDNQFNPRGSSALVIQEVAV